MITVIYSLLDIGTEPSLGHHVADLAHQLQPDLILKDGRVTMCNVCEGPGADEY